MATLASLKEALRNAALEATRAPHSPLMARNDLTEDQYRDGFNIFLDGCAAQSTDPTSVFPSNSYKDFIIPKLIQVFESFLSRSSTSSNAKDKPVKLAILEIGPGPRTVLSHLPTHLRCLVKRYVCLEPKMLYWSSMCDWERQEKSKRPEDKTFPCLTEDWENRNYAFELGYDRARLRTFDIILFCHSMYGMDPKHELIKTAARLVSDDGVVVVFHRDDGSIDFGNEDGELDESTLVCHSTASFPTGAVRVANDERTLNLFGPFIAEFDLMHPGSCQDQVVRRIDGYPWYTICRDMGRTEGERLYFSAPDVMRVFTRHARTAIDSLAKKQILLFGRSLKLVKNREVHLYRPAAILRPANIEHVQEAVRWALENRTPLTILGGGHSGHCVSSNIVALDMCEFDGIDISSWELPGTGYGQLIIAGAGCKAGHLVETLSKSGLTVPLGSRPSVGAGLWLQGGLGHLSRLYGLSCDSIVGAVVVSVKSGEILCVGSVPPTHRPTGARVLQPGDEDHDDLLWAIKGAGTNFGIVVRVVFKATSAPKSCAAQSWTVSHHCSNREAQRQQLHKYDQLVAKKLPQSCSADAYLYWINGKFCLMGVTVFEAQLSHTSNVTTTINLRDVLGPADSFAIVNNMELFDTDLYMTSQMHGGHGGGKTSSFKRCLFFKHIGDTAISDLLIDAMSECPTELCYLHILHGGGAVNHVDANATAFGCRGWNYALVITGVWPRDKDGTDVARDAVAWVYRVATELLPLSTGAYSADLGPDPRDAALAIKAFGPNLPRLAQLKQKFDPHNILAYACPLQVPRDKSRDDAKTSKLVVLITGEEGAGKDYCALRFLSVFRRKGFKSQIASISDVTKKEYAQARGADFDRLLRDRAYKEQHRPALTAFFQDQVRQRPRLPEDHFQSLVVGVEDVDVLFITGIRDEAPVATLAHLVPESRVMDVRIEASEDVRRGRRGVYIGQSDQDRHGDTEEEMDHYRPTFKFSNNQQDTTSPNGPRSHTRTQIEFFALTHLIPFLGPDLGGLANLTHAIPDFPRQGITFRHVLGIAEQPGGLDLSTALLEKHFSLAGGNHGTLSKLGRTPAARIADNNPWSKAQVTAIISCEAGGFIFASALASRVGVPLALIRKGGKIPPPVFSVARSEGKSNISSLLSSPPATPTPAVGKPETLMTGADDVDMGVDEGDRESDKIEIGTDVVRRIRDGGGSVVVVDDVLATGSTLCAVLRLLVEAGGIEAEKITVLVVAEFPVHRGRDLLRRKGFGMVDIRSLLIFGGV